MNRKKTLIITSVICVVIIGAGVAFQVYQRQTVFQRQEETFAHLSVRAMAEGSEEDKGEEEAREESAISDSD